MIIRPEFWFCVIDPGPFCTLDGRQATARQPRVEFRAVPRRDVRVTMGNRD